MAVVEESKSVVEDEAQKLQQRGLEIKMNLSAKGTQLQLKRKMGPTQMRMTMREVSGTTRKAVRSSCKRMREMTDHISDGDEAKSLALERAKKLQENLTSEFPSFIKSMLPSHVTGGFWLGLPKPFCDVHLPKNDTTIVLVDESQKEHDTRYLVGKTGLSGGWRGFSVAHGLLEKDVLVFHLVQPTKFMVYIVRAKISGKVEQGLVLLNLEVPVKQEDFAPKDAVMEKHIEMWKSEENGEEDCLKTLFPNIPRKNSEKESISALTSEPGLAASQSEKDTEIPGSQVPEGIRFTECAVDFKEVKSIEDFTILVNGLVINSEFSKHLKTKYYELCRTQKSFLHDHLPDGLNCKLVAGIISETVNIADAIRASKITTSRDNFAIWAKTLKSFQELGMNVAFLRDRLDQLMSFGFEANRKIEARLERLHAEEKIRTLQASLLHVKEVKMRLDAEIEALNLHSGKHELMFEDIAKAPW